jgi:hypothetical protein
MSYDSKLALVKEMLDNAESHLRTARQIWGELSPDGTAKSEDVKQLKKQYEETASSLPSAGFADEGERVVEGIFDGQSMIGKDQQLYPVPANYASKSKLVAGDSLKLIISDDGRFTYKQIGPIDRKRVTGTLVQEDGQFKVLSAGKSFKVLLASVTYFRAEIGDKITLLVPMDEKSEWGAIENVLPQNEEHPEELILGHL